MFKIVVFSCFLLSISALQKDTLPRKVPSLDGRIIGGESVDIKNYPYQLSLQYLGSHICGASIISAKWAVTAAHCTDGSSALLLSVRAGSSIRGSGGQVISVKKIHQNPQYDSSTIDYDISLLELSSNLKFEAGVNVVGLPKVNQQLPVGKLSVVSGWGTLKEGGSTSSQLQAVRVTVVSNEECNTAYGGRSITDRMMCAGEKVGGKDACQGDSGGPLVVDGELIGIVSWGYGCARPSYPGVYASVPNLREFISKVSGI
nr:trypsin-7-like [Onthophagus taurus]